MKIKPFDVVAILEDHPAKGLVRGQVGTVAGTLAPVMSKNLNGCRRPGM
jgi:hypothetical protein